MMSTSSAIQFAGGRQAGNAAVAPVGGSKHHNKRRRHRVFFTFSSTMAGMLADGKVQVNYRPADGWCQPATGRVATGRVTEKTQ
jgi:hypothetical protein